MENENEILIFFVLFSNFIPELLHKREICCIFAAVFRGRALTRIFDAESAVSENE